MTSPERIEDRERTVALGHELTARLMGLIGDVAELSSRLGQLESANEQLYSLLDEFETRAAALAAQASPEGTDPAGPAPAGAGADDPSPENELGLDLWRLVAWVRENVAYLLERKLPQSQAPYWCRKWWLHPEAIARFEAARRSWEEAVVSPGSAMVVYYEHLDHQLGVLTSPNGPFCWCKDAHSAGPIARRLIGHDEPDEDYFLTYEQARQQIDHTTTGSTGSPPQPATTGGTPPLGGPRVNQRQATARGRQ